MKSVCLPVQVFTSICARKCVLFPFGSLLILCSLIADTPIPNVYRKMKKNIVFENRKRSPYNDEMQMERGEIDKVRQKSVFHPSPPDINGMFVE